MRRDGRWRRLCRCRFRDLGGGTDEDEWGSGKKKEKRGRTTDDEDRHVTGAGVGRWEVGARRARGRGGRETG
jgi:hypothetical protein